MLPVLLAQVPSACHRPSTTVQIDELDARADARHSEILEYLGERFEVWPAELRARYPLGYKLFFVSGTEVYTPYDDGIPDITIRWEAAEARATQDKLWIQLPDIIHDATGKGLRGIQLIIKRREGHVSPMPIQGVLPFDLEVRVLGTQEASALAVLGARPRRSTPEYEP